MLVNVKVIPKSSRNLIKEEASRLKAYVTAPADKGKANQAVVELLAEYYKVKKGLVRIVRGERSHNKTVAVG